MSLQEYPFPVDPASTGYCVFPAELEDDPLVWFHATPVANYTAIVQHGFRSAASLGTGLLTSVSFGRRSVTALTHLIDRRRSFPGDYHIIAVRYEGLDRTGLTVISMICTTIRSTRHQNW